MAPFRTTAARHYYKLHEDPLCADHALDPLLTVANE